jgi:hypothetical protein
MSLYANQALVKKTIELFCEVRQCVNCNRYFCELENVGMWQCKYHPGDFNADTGRWSCCGEKRRRPHFTSEYMGISPYLTWSGKNKWQQLKPYSDGCKRRDCVPSRSSGLHDKEITLDGIASLVPYMKPPIKDRPGLKKTPLRLLRQEPFPRNVWYDPPHQTLSDED